MPMMVDGCCGEGLEVEAYADIGLCLGVEVSQAGLDQATGVVNCVCHCRSSVGVKVGNALYGAAGEGVS